MKGRLDPNWGDLTVAERVRLIAREEGVDLPARFPDARYALATMPVGARLEDFDDLVTRVERYDADAIVVRLPDRECRTAAGALAPRALIVFARGGDEFPPAVSAAIP